MLQRKQSIFMSLTAIFMVTALFIPVGRISFEQELFVMDHLPLMLTTLLILGLQAYNLSLYKSRKRQLKLNYYSLAALLGLAGLLHFYVYEDPLTFDLGVTLEKSTLGSCIPLLGILSQILAIRGIKQDEAMIRSMNRFR